MIYELVYCSYTFRASQSTLTVATKVIFESEASNLQNNSHLQVNKRTLKYLTY